jgi:predicted membrane-bound spermidine synthase
MRSVRSPLRNIGREEGPPASEERRLKYATTSSANAGTSSSNMTSNPAVSASELSGECEAFDVAIIDSTDFTVDAASKLHSAAFYAALHDIMRSEAAMIQIVEIYMRIFEQEFQHMEAALRQSGWSGVGRSSVYTPSYSGEALMLHAVKYQHP